MSKQETGNRMGGDMMHRGSPKKRFLWRRMLPMLADTSMDITRSNDRTAFSHQQETPARLIICHDRKREKKRVNKEFEVGLVENKLAQLDWKSPPEDESCSSSLERTSNMTTRQSQQPQLTVQRKVSLEESQSSEGSEEDFPSCESLDLSNIKKQHESNDALAGSVRGSHQVVSTAASVLLLMRYSVSEEAINRLSSAKKPRKETLKAAPTSTCNKQEVNETPVPTESPPSSSLALQDDKPLDNPSETPLRRVSTSSIGPECPNRLAMPEDPNELNSLHCFVRAHLLEVFSLPSQKDKPGRVGLRCVFCAHLPRKDRAGTTMCTFYPKSLQDLYRSVMTWQRLHFRVCKHVSNKLKDEYWKHKESDQTRGKTTYWVTSAMRLGLQDISHGRNGIYYSNPNPNHHHHPSHSPSKQGQI
ncbi:expressed unknown protein [Seminavis robusta]|uniref:Uncharacterized protein n=1 Tax=Seminavis robusta TaxID=568900 RepID=A0A9N8E1T0_9STRA|nr:expressed unknown protein [Seminavis robusta]|eukprot:Sro565_g167620.1 n/a (417) ;mRNA; r:34674-36004